MELAPSSVTRSIELPVSADAAWHSLRSPDGLAGWLGETVDLDDVVAGAAGLVTEGGTVRRLVVTEVDEGRSIGFVWWDEATPEQASVVTIALAPAGEDEGSTTVTVTERFAGSASASASASLRGAAVADLAGIEASWDRRLQALVGDSALTAACV